MLDNWFRNTLLIIAILAAVVGAILLFNGLNPPEPRFDGDTVDVLPLLIWGGAFSGAAVLSFFHWLHASAISWAAENPSPPRGESD